MGMLIKYGAGGEHEFGVEFYDMELPSRQEALAELTRQVAGVHGLAKRVPSETVAKALKNEPFEDYPRAVYGYKRAYGEGGKAKARFDQSYAHAVEGFLRQTYNSLTFIPEISFDIENVSEKDERRALNAAIARYRASNLGSQISSLEEAYNGLEALRTVFRHVRKYSDLSIETIVPSRYLPELLMAAPVWFVESKKPFWSIDPLEKWRELRGEKPGGSQSRIVRYFCNLGATDQFAHLFQIYNHTPHNFNEFTGRDVMPLPIIELVRQVRAVFDYLVIATPYHDLAAKEWQDARWIRNIDPFLFGFLKQVPELMFFLGRWSGTGLFPLVGEMIADTIEHIRKNWELLHNINRKISWYRGGYVNPQTGDEGLFYQERYNYGGRRHQLIMFVADLFERFENERLFSWLRGEDK